MSLIFPLKKLLRSRNLFRKMNDALVFGCRWHSTPLYMLFVALLIFSKGLAAALALILFWHFQQDLKRIQFYRDHIPQVGLT